MPVGIIDVQFLNFERTILLLILFFVFWVRNRAWTTLEVRWVLSFFMQVFNSLINKFHPLLKIQLCFFWNLWVLHRLPQRKSLLHSFNLSPDLLFTGLYCSTLQSECPSKQPLVSLQVKQFIVAVKKFFTHTVEVLETKGEHFSRKIEGHYGELPLQLLLILNPLVEVELVSEWRRNYVHYSEFVSYSDANVLYVLILR